MISYKMFLSENITEIDRVESWLYNSIFVIIAECSIYFDMMLSQLEAKVFFLYMKLNKIFQDI